LFSLSLRLPKRKKEKKRKNLKRKKEKKKKAYRLALPRKKKSSKIGESENLKIICFCHIFPKKKN